ncbi:SDR family oxidoreductase [Oxalicibacterium faecigallinarum]|uniref:dTDP-4-dehydrorhamnose reductase n=1 Tax=Oxalicibacterium faecigallinarum TaxID=573741 RepID=A0A8J3APT2_9BURK|nr:sugar nucleotide-binding protein [Oxalicibacterium faecigallinarum]GGI17888.1 hypothetical protein GCM10008066_11240 [Oxalicibacterium faecigallinarum]
MCFEGLGELDLADRTQVDLQNPTQIGDVIRSVKPQLIFNSATYTAVDRAESESGDAHQREPPAVMAEKAKKLGAVMIHYSTDYVFDGTKQGAYTKQDPSHPQSVFGRSKLAGEQAVQSARDSPSDPAYELGVWIARTEFSVYD